jgi:hypothetical protein
MEIFTLEILSEKDGPWAGAALARHDGRSRACSLKTREKSLGPLTQTDC